MKNKALSLIFTTFFVIGINTNISVKADDYSPSTVKQISKDDYIQQISGSARIDWTKQEVIVTGTGAPPEKGSAAQRRLMSIRAAKVDAYRQLLEVIEGVHINAETTVRDFVTESDVIKTQVTGIVKGATQVGPPKYLSDGSVEVVMTINMFGNKSVASVIIPPEIKEEAKIPVVPSKVEPATVSENYTSLILDCKELDVLPAMSPAIFDADGGELYVSNLPIDPDYVINQGIVSYARSISQAEKNERAGSNPLIIKAQGVKGLFKSDMTISNTDAKKLLGAEEKNSFLKNFKVIMILK
ncbi:MAG: LPP20 family lipoprotein [Candidatus Sericytochromatia bacterium]|nr:LPP20 family lipoprotein [Candidatus Sericytochromatia bacterium]